jgi:predicted DCC family thiol-disulfide oxidoreductase YuxK
MARPQPATAIVFFDGFCNLCNATVDFLIRHDRRGRLRFASLQSPRGLRECGSVHDGGPGSGGAPASVVLAHDGRLYRRSGAVLRAVALLGGPWRLAAVLLVIPRPLRDAVYRLVAARRYRWFGRRETCRAPSTGERDRFLED